ncbi:unnamed protein product [Durusdinium trenchii]|uniref:Uncharacterized protein n=1 Tax=Durusdinium trenchii TaxID=1381693 RepID=A0ABP0M7L5_9DINO
MQNADDASSNYNKRLLAVATGSCLPKEESLQAASSEEALLYRKVCLTYDLDPTQFYTYAKWPEDVQPSEQRPGLVNRLLSLLGLTKTEADNAEPSAPAPSSPSTWRPFSFCYQPGADLPVCQAAGHQEVVHQQRCAGISPFARNIAQTARGFKNWKPVMPAEEIDFEDEGQSQLGGELDEPSRRPLQQRCPTRPTQSFENAQPPMVRGRPLPGAKRVLPLEGASAAGGLVDAKRRKLSSA